MLQQRKTPLIDSNPVSRETTSWAEAAAAWSGFPLEAKQISQLGEYADWLRKEADPAGLIGPRESNRIWPRHIADSLVFAVGWERSPESMVDIGTGAGLPGIPLAVLWPECEVTLVDRSQPRADLLLRLTHVLGLVNAQVLVSEARQLHRSSGIVMRAVFPPAEAVRLSADLLLPEGRAVLAWTHRVTLEEVQASPGLESFAFETRSVPGRILDESRVLLIMTARG